MGEFEDFEAYVFKLFQERTSRRKELDVLVNFYGRKRLEDLWKKYRAQQEQLKRDREKERLKQSQAV